MQQEACAAIAEQTSNLHLAYSSSALTT